MAEDRLKAAREALSSRLAAIGRMGRALLEAERRELEEIEAALQRIANGTYGDCERCGGAIGRQRLRAVPEARRCLLCSEVSATLQ